MEDSPRRPAEPLSMLDRRVAACVKACEGIPTVALERDVLIRLVAPCINVQDLKIRELMEEMSPPRPRFRGSGLRHPSPSARPGARRERKSQPRRSEAQDRRARKGPRRSSLPLKTDT